MCILCAVTFINKQKTSCWCLFLLINKISKHNLLCSKPGHLTDSDITRATCQTNQNINKSGTMLISNAFWYFLISVTTKPNGTLWCIEETFRVCTGPSVISFLRLNPFPEGFRGFETLRRTDSPESPASGTRPLCTGTCPCRPAAAHSSSGLGRCLLHKWPCFLGWRSVCWYQE